MAFAVLDTYIHEHYTEKKRLAEILENFTYENFMANKAEWLKSGRMLWYVYGNLTKEDAIQITQSGTSLMQLQSVPKDSLSHVR